MKKKLSNKAFTLIELLVVMAILGSLATFVVINFTGAQASARDAKRKEELSQYRNAVEVYASKNNFKYPQATSVIDAESLCVTGGDLEGLPCTADEDFGYKYISYSSEAQYVLWTKMERTSGTSHEFFVICSTGEAGIYTTNPTNDNPTITTCPI